MASEVIIRKARHEDYDDILEIGDAMGGRDFIYFFFHAAVDDPNVQSFVAVVGKKVVGLYYLQINDNGQSATKKGARVHKDFQNRGIHTLLSETLDKKVLENPKIKRVTLILQNIEDRLFKRFNQNGYHELLRKRSLNFVFNVKNIRQLNNNELTSIANVKKMTSEDLKSLFENEVVVERIFPGKLFFDKISVLRTFDGNIPYLINDNASVYATTTSHCQDKDVSNDSSHTTNEKVRNFTDGEISRIDMVSSNLIFPAHDGTLMYMMDIYSSTIVSSLMAHMQFHLKTVKEVNKENGVLTCAFDDEGLANDMIPFITDFGFGKEVNFPDSVKFWYEKDVCRN